MADSNYLRGIFSWIGIFFNLCFAFLAIEVIPLDLSLAAVQIYLLTKDYDTTFLEIFHTKFHS